MTIKPIDWGNKCINAQTQILLCGALDARIEDLSKAIYNWKPQIESPYTRCMRDCLRGPSRDPKEKMALCNRVCQGLNRETTPRYTVAELTEEMEIFRELKNEIEYRQEVCQQKEAIFPLKHYE